MLKTTLNISCGTIEHCDWASQKRDHKTNTRTTALKIHSEKRENSIVRSLFVLFNWYHGFELGYRDCCVWYLWYVILYPLDTGYWIIYMYRVLDASLPCNFSRLLLVLFWFYFWSSHTIATFSTQHSAHPDGYHSIGNNVTQVNNPFRYGCMHFDLICKISQKYIVLDWDLILVCIIRNSIRYAHLFG